MELSKIGVIILLVVGVIVAFAMLPSIADSQAKMTKLMVVNNETQDLTHCFAVGTQGQVNESNPLCNVTIANAATSTDWRFKGCPISSLSMTNTNGTVITLSTSYTFNSTTGLVSYLNTTQTNSSALSGSINKTLLTYSFCDPGYVTESSGRSIAGLITLFAVLAIVAFAIWGLGRNSDWW